MIILNYPRCGSNFLWYSIKEITGIILGKTHGQNKEFCEENYHDKLIFMIRNYKECIPRQTKDYSFGEKFKSQLLNYKTNSDEHHFDYISVLEYYDKYEKDKIIIYYEDFISNTTTELLKVIKFIVGDIDEIKINQYIENIELHKKNSSDRYRSIVVDGCMSIDLSGNVNIKHHSSKIPKDLRLEIDKYISNEYKYYFDKYLTRYSE
jgi:hypothetical protein